MSLYSQNFTLLPHPKKSIFSTCKDESIRATLPDFQNAMELKEFVKRLMIYNFEIPGFYPQILLNAGIAMILLFTFSSILLRRLLDRNFWLFRIQDRGTGKLIIPNSILAFCLALGLYTNVFITLIWFYFAWYKLQTKLPHHSTYFVLLCWAPMIFGAELACCGIFLSIPSQESLVNKQRASNKGKISQFFSKSIVLNIIMVAYPLVVLVLIIIPGSIADHKFEYALALQQQFLKEYASQEEFTQEMVQSAQIIWYADLKALYYINITFILWSFLGFTMTIAYSTSVFRLLHLIRNSLKINNAQQKGWVVTTYYNGDSKEEEKGKQEEEEKRTLKSIRKDSKIKKPILTYARQSSELMRDTIYQQVNSSNQQAEQVTTSQAISIEDIPNESIKDTPLIKRLLRNLIYRPDPADSLPSYEEHLRKLKRAYFHLQLQFVAVGPSAFAFSCVASYLAASCYGSLETPKGIQNPGTLLENVIGVGILCSCYVTSCGGLLTLISVVTRAYEISYHSISLKKFQNDNSNLPMIPIKKQNLLSRFQKKKQADNAKSQSVYKLSPSFYNKREADTIVIIGKDNIENEEPKRVSSDTIIQPKENSNDNIEKRNNEYALQPRPSSRINRANITTLLNVKQNDRTFLLENDNNSGDHLTFGRKTPVASSIHSDEEEADAYFSPTNVKNHWRNSINDRQ